jgi:hypothetical protein
MATNTANICIGAATVSIGAYVAAGGASTLVDVGHTKEAVTLTPSFDDYPITSERAFGPLKKIPIGGTFKLSVSMIESTIENYRVAFRQAAGSTSGTAPNLTLRVGDFAQQYHQLSIVSSGVGSTSVRTITAWRAIVESVEAVPYGKTGEQMLKVTFDLMYDDSVSTADKFLKIVDA